MLAAVRGHEAVIRLLIEQKDLDINAKNEVGGGVSMMNTHSNLTSISLFRTDCRL